MIAVDDLNDWVGFLAGHPQVKTPGLDLLAKRSTVFRHAYCTAPVCSPSRAGALTGLSVQSTGVTTNNQTFPNLHPDMPEIDDIFRLSGYQVQRYGKIDHVYTTVATPLPSPIPYSNKVCYAPAGEAGFDWGPAGGGEADQPDYIYAQQGIDYLAKTYEKPFFLAVGFIRTHVGWFVPQKYFDLYPPADQIVLPTAPSDDLDDLGPVAKSLATKPDFHKCITDQHLWGDAVRAYLASISFVDSQIARLITALDASPHAKNTTIVLWSDHGFHLGEKFHWHKEALWERATRVPFLISLPGQSVGASVEAPVSLMDMAPTLLDLESVTSPYQMDGQSLRPLLEDPALTWQRPVLTTMNTNDNAIRTAKWRYIRYGTGERELYDEQADSGEYKNLASDPSYASVISELDGYMPPLV